MSSYRETLWSHLMEFEGDELDLVVERVEIEPGRSFSEEAMEKLYDELLVFIGTRVMRRWNATNEPPTGLRVELRVTAS